MKKPRIVVIGLSGQSVFIKVDHFHQPGETLIGKSLFIEPGGKGYNQAVAAARLGAEVSFITATGNDDYGKECIKRLILEQIDCKYSVVYEDIRTAYAVILTDPNGENRVTVYHGASGCLQPDDIKAAEHMIANSDALLIQLEIPIETVEFAITMANNYNVPVFLNPAPAVKLETGLLEKVSLIIPNKQEAQVIFSLDDNSFENVSKIREALLKHRVNQAVITMGDAGALVVTREYEERIHPVHIIPVDTTGAGDVFSAAITVALLSKKTLADAANFAAKAAAISVTRRGVLNSIPSAIEVASCEL
ncbi:MAG TPA: PfkB family carbohydrate kinase [Clostridia bacterium]